MKVIYYMISFSKYKFFFLAGFLLMVVFHNLSAQIEYSGKPVGNQLQEKVLLNYIKLPSAVLLQEQSEEIDQQDKFYKKDNFAAAVELDIIPSKSGAWHTGPGNLRVWRIGITAPEASSLNLIFKDFQLLPGCRLFVYSPAMDIVFGAFTFRNNKKSNVLAISPVTNDSLIIELQLEKGIENFGRLQLSKVGVGFPGETIFKDTQDEYFGWSAACHVDINCEIEEHIQRQKYAVCRIIFDGTTRCTGTLINNMEQNGRPLILTAGHCLYSSNTAESALYFFDYESPYCNGPDGRMKSISGSTLLSRADGLDFSLAELSEKPPADYYPLYAGWDIRELAFDNIYSVHHPEGDVKKVTTDSDAIDIGTFEPFDSETHWLVTEYDTGTTEAGSSGGALFNSSNRVIGTLTGGNEACSQYIYDYYQMISHSWADYTNSNEQLMVWLDPIGSGSEMLDSYAPIDPLYAVSEEMSNQDPEASDTLIQIAGGWGYISGHNHLLTTEYAEHFTMKGSKYIHAVKMNVAKREFSDLQSKIKVKVWNDDVYPNDLLFERDLYYYEMVDNENFIRLDTILYVNESFYVGYEIDYSNSEDTFAVYTSVPNLNESTNTVFVRSNDQWLPLTDGEQIFITSLGIVPVVMNYYPPDKNNPEDFPVKEVTLYPNPTYGDLQVLFKEEPSDDVQIFVYDSSGRLVLDVTRYSPEPNFVLNTTSLRAGVFLMRITQGGVETTLKFVKL